VTPPPPPRYDQASLTALLAGAGFVAPEEEAAELLACVGQDDDEGARLEALVSRRLTGEPLAWVTGTTTFCDLQIRVEPGVYVPRWHSEQLARRAVELLPSDGGIAIDLCTGSGAIAKTMAASHPFALIVASDLDERAVACARANGVQSYRGELFDPLPASLNLEGRVDLVAAVVPYVPTPALALLQRDTLSFESTLSYDGGPDGTAILRRVLAESPGFLRPGGVVLLELGGDEADLLEDELAERGYVDVAVLLDDDDDVRGLEATWAG
jgi:release factor glutamine methyltransferase